SVPKCNSYLHLLDNLKKTYEDFKNSVHDEIKNNYHHLAERLQALTIENADSYFVGKFKAFDFSNEKCNPQKAKELGSPKKEEQPPGPQSASQKSGASLQSKPKDSENSEGNTGDTPGNKGNSNSENGSPGGGSSGGSGSPGSGKGSGEGAPGSGANGGPKAPKDQAATQSSGKSNGGWLSLWRTSLNPMSYMPNASSIYQASKDVLISTTNKISDTYTNTMISITGAYNNAMTSITGAYNNVMTSITDAYDRTTNYIGNAVNSVTSQLNSFGTSQLGDNQSGPNSLGGGVDTSNQSQTNPKHPVNPPQSPSQSTPPQTPPDPSPKSIDSQTSSTPIQQIAPTDGNRTHQPNGMEA
ncbi:hypothetical protein YYG_05189, partial [Plasmodium vinckei petteri]